MYKVERVSVNWILNSGGEAAIEAEVVFEGIGIGRASAASAIRAGRRERMVTGEIKESISWYKKRIKCLENERYDQQSWDKTLQLHSEWGTDIVLALSLAFARGAAIYSRKRLIEYINDIGISEKISLKSPIILVPIFSGGIHHLELGGSPQQIMIAVNNDKFEESVEIIQSFYDTVMHRLKREGHMQALSASSGFLTNGLSMDQQLQILTEELLKQNLDENVSIGIDIAAEHLKKKEGYIFYGDIVSADAFGLLWKRVLNNYPITYLEDPFDAEDIDNWKDMYEQSGDYVDIFSDDLSATQTAYFNSSIVDGVIVKLKQVGTLTDALKMIMQVRKSKMKICVSHRSYETEDTFMCDLGVATSADYMKIGGPRRGDRVEKYNQLLRLYRSIQ